MAIKASTPENFPAPERYMLVKEYRYPDTTHRFYYVGDEGYSTMMHLGQIFTECNCSPMLKEIHEFYENIEEHLKNAPAAVRSIVLYPISLHKNYSHAE